MAPRNETVIVTGSSGFIGRTLVDELARRYRIVGLDLVEPSELPPDASFVPIDLTTEDGVRNSLRQVRERHGRRIASVIHLAAYFDLTGEPNPKYEEVTVRGTEREPAPPQRRRRCRRSPSRRRRRLRPSGRTSPRPSGRHRRCRRSSRPRPSSRRSKFPSHKRKVASGSA